MKQKRWLFFLWLAASVAILAASIVFKWQRWTDFPTDGGYPSFMRDHLVNTPNLVSNLGGLISFYLTSLVVYFFLPRMVHVIGNAPAQRGGFMRAALFGLLSALLVFVIVVSAAVGSHTFPFAIVITGLTLIASMIGMVAIELRLGAWLATLAGWQEASPVIQLLLAILVVYPFTLLPSVGGLFIIAFDLIGLGTVVLARVKSTYPWNDLRTNFENKTLEKDLME